MSEITTKAATINLDDKGRSFAGVATIRAAIFDVIDSGDTDLWENDFVPESVATDNRGTFVDAVITRIAELQSPPDEGIKLENLCDKHKREVLPRPTVQECVACEAERKVSNG